MSGKSTEPDYTIVVRPLPDAVPATARLRRLLKGLLRAYGFRCLSVLEVPREGKLSGASAAGKRDDISAG